MNATELKFLTSLSTLINTQDHRLTGNPLCEVRDKLLVYGVSSDYTDKYHWIDKTNDEIVTDKAEIKSLNALSIDKNYSDKINTGASYTRYQDHPVAGNISHHWVDSDSGKTITDKTLIATIDSAYEDSVENTDTIGLGSYYHRVGYVEVDQTIETFFSIEAADLYILNNKKHLNAPFTYVVSANNNPEMLMIRKLLSGDIIESLQMLNPDIVLEDSTFATTKKHKI